jgi:uncharacterized protein DUF4234
MAQVIEIPGAGTTAKIRNPLGVIALSIVTLSIYYFVWWYFINREMADLGRANHEPNLGEAPVWSVVAITLGVILIVPPFVSYWRTCRRVERAQNLVLGSNNFSPVLAFVLIFIPLLGFVSTYLVQSNLNQVWERGAMRAAAA